MVSSTDVFFFFHRLNTSQLGLESCHMSMFHQELSKLAEQFQTYGAFQSMGPKLSKSWMAVLVLKPMATWGTSVLRTLQISHSCDMLRRCSTKGWVDECIVKWCVCHVDTYQQLTIAPTKISKKSILPTDSNPHGSWAHWSPRISWWINAVLDD